MSAFRFTAIAISAVTVAALAACAPVQAQDDGLIHIVASTSVWGNIAATVGGDLVSVESIIDSSNQDPHSYEASAQDQLALSRADLVIENGGGYDPFVDTLLEAAGSTATVIDATEASGLLDGDDNGHGADEHDHDDHDAGEEHGHIEGFNEHVWYDFHGVARVAEAIAHELGELDPANEATYESNAAALFEQLQTLEADAAALAAEFNGEGAAVTEPVPVYLLENAGLINRTPEDFTEAIEEGGDVPPAALRATLALFEERAVVVLGYNDQTASPETERVREAAEAAGIPVVAFAEILPEGSDYVSWMTANLEALGSALRG